MEQGQLILTPTTPEEAHAYERMVRYRREYWQQYKHNKRVYGTLTPEEYAEIKAMADANGRPVWQEIWQQSLAYRQKRYLPPEDVKEEISKLYAELRQFNDSVRQLAEKNNLFGRMRMPPAISDRISELEARIERFTKKPWITS
ncbi:MAG: hypothetical protein ACPGUC_01165 [Gammaproteobacteria bacterium]